MPPRQNTDVVLRPPRFSVAKGGGFDWPFTKDPGTKRSSETNAKTLLRMVQLRPKFCSSPAHLMSTARLLETVTNWEAWSR